MEKVSAITEGVCDVCRRVLPDHTDGGRHGESLANWGKAQRTWGSSTDCNCVHAAFSMH